MNIGFYWHFDAVFDGTGAARLPSHIGVFVEELACQAGAVTLYAHSGEPTGREDHELRPPLVRPVDLGPRRSAPTRVFMPRRVLKRYRPASDGVDVMLLRGPSPLLPHLARASGDVPVAALVVGSYEDRSQRRTFPWWRERAIRILVGVYELLEKRSLRRAVVLVNSGVLFGRYAGRCVRVAEVFTSSLDEAAMTEARNVRRGPSGSSFRILFTGRIAEEKGLYEAVRAVRMLVDRGFEATLRIVGWSDAGDPTAHKLDAHAVSLGISDRFERSGFRSGDELWDVYRRADIFVLPSWSEGFPHTLIEALAFGLPVVASRVGGIPERLEHERTALLIEPRSAEALADALERLFTDAMLRDRLIEAGRHWVQGFTNERSCEAILEHLRWWVEAQAVRRSG